MSGSVTDERNFPGRLPGNLVVQTEKSAHAGLGKDCMRRLGKDVIAEISSVERASRSEVRYSLTEKCEKCTTWESPSSTISIRLEHVDRTAS